VVPNSSFEADGYAAAQLQRQGSHMKLGGWTRLGIVVSVLWLCAVVALVAMQLNTATPSNTGSLVRFVHGSTPDPDVHFINGQPVHGIVWDIAAVNYPVAFAVLFIPLAFLWLGIPLLLFTYRWVCRGFRSDP
jgi:hypothetical protein